MATTITSIDCKDIRFPTSLGNHGSDAMHPDPDYSAAYVTIHTSTAGLQGYGLTFTLGRGTEVIVACVHALAPLLQGKSLDSIFDNFAAVWRSITSESQLRWLGPEKGVIHLATAALVNALWDLWARKEGKPLWRLLVDMEPAKLVSTIDFRYIRDALTPEEAVAILEANRSSIAERVQHMEEKGFPAYTTSAGWLGYSDDLIRELCREGIAQGWSNFKIKVGADLQDDIRRCKVIRDVIGYERRLMVDANQRWDVPEAIAWMEKLAPFKPTWIEEPVSPDDVLGHAAVAHAVRPWGIGVATGEQCQNRVIFKQLLQAKAIDFCQIDSCRMGGVNEIISVILMAKKFNVPVCPHAGGVGLCEYVQHLSIWDYVCVSASLENRMLEFVDHLHEHFEDPVVMKDGHYMPPKKPGYSIEMKAQSLRDHEYPHGPVWTDLRARNLKA